MHSWNTFGAQTNHEQTQIHNTHKTHHGPDLGEAITFPLILFSVLGHGPYTQMSFCPENPEIHEIRTPTTLEAHNYLYKHLIEVRSKAKL